MLKHFLVYFKRYRTYFLLAILSLFVVDLLDVALPLVIKYAIDNLTKPEPLKILLYCALGYVGIVLVQGIGRFWYRLFFWGTSQRVARDVRNELFSHLQSLSTNFFNRAYTGDIMSRATSDIEAVRQFYAIGMFIGADILVYFLTVPIIMLFLSVKLTLLSIILLPLLPFFVNRMGNLIHNRFKEIQATFAQLSTQAQENFAGIRVVKSFAQEENQIRSFAEANQKYLKQNLALAKLESVFTPTLQLSAGLGILIVLFFGGIEVIHGNISTGTFVAFPFFLGRLLWPMMGLGWTISVFQRSFASMQRLQEIFNIKPEITSPAQPIIAPLKGEIEFRNVTLSYPLGDALSKDEGKIPSSPAAQSEPVLKGINLKIPAGTTVAIMGPVGAGKTSLINLVPRLFDPNQGEVLIDAINTKRYDLGNLRQQIGFVSQDVFLFSESIKDNIAFGRPENPSEEEVIKSAERAMVHRDIEDFPEKYGTLLGERGINLSGGQKQRLTIARALFKDPRILILDDCLSSVDVDTEEIILNQLRKVLGKRTTLIISHRLPVVKIADLIIFMEDGRIVETGKHSELLARQGRYARFYQQQQLINELAQIN